MKKNKSVYIAFIAIAMVAVVFGILNSKTLGERVSLQKNAEIVFKVGGENPVVMTMEDLETIGFTEFKANLKKNGKAPVEHDYAGVLLKTALKEAGIELDGKSHIEAKAVDGYTSAIPLEKVIMDDNVYIAVMMDGKPLISKEDDGPGPYQIIISKDKFSQYWCKWAVEVNVQ